VQFFRGHSVDDGAVWQKKLKPYCEQAKTLDISPSGIDVVSMLHLHGSITDDSTRRH